MQHLQSSLFIRLSPIDPSVFHSSNVPRVAIDVDFPRINQIQLAVGLYPPARRVHGGSPLIFPQSSFNYSRRQLFFFSTNTSLSNSSRNGQSIYQFVDAFFPSPGSREFLFQNSRCFLYYYYFFFFKQPQPRLHLPPPLFIHPRTLPKRVD